MYQTQEKLKNKSFKNNILSFGKHLDVLNILQFLDYSTIHNTLSWKEHGNKPSESAVKSASNPNKAFENYLQTYGDQLYKEIEFLEDVNQDKDSKAKDKLLIQITNNSENHLSLDNIHPNFYKNMELFIASDAINSPDKTTIDNKKRYKSSHFSSPPEGSQPDSIKEETNEIGNLHNGKYR